MSATARLRILHQPHIGAGVVRYEVECKYSVTGLTSVPTPAFDLTQEMLILVAGYAHEERCGECDVSPVLDRGDREVRELTEQAWARVQAAAMKERAN
jgi:hypothetical protein